MLNVCFSQMGLNRYLVKMTWVPGSWINAQIKNDLIFKFILLCLKMSAHQMTSSETSYTLENAYLNFEKNA